MLRYAYGFDQNEARLTCLSQCAHIDGELSSLRVQLRTIEADFKEFKDINKRYRDQLIKVKVCMRCFLHGRIY